MYLVLSFIGKLPEYVIHCIYQIRLYTSLPVYLIYNDYKSCYLDKIKTMDVNLINYSEVSNNKILQCFKNKFSIIRRLGDRSELFFRSFERFYLLKNLMKLKNLNRVVFLEIDNLIYEDPSVWFDKLQDENIKMSFMFDNINRISSGIAYFKDYHSIKLLTDYFDNSYLPNTKHFTEMDGIYRFYNTHKDVCYILPSLNYNDSNIPELGQNYHHFNTIFDPSTYGIYLLGIDPFHTKGKIVLHQKWVYGYINPTNNIKWITNDGKKKPYIVTDNNNILISNLHVHSKDLLSGLSIPYS